MKTETTSAEMILHAEEVLTISRNGEAEVTVGATRVVVPRDHAALRVVNVKHRIEFGTKASGPDMDFKRLALRRGEAEEILVGLRREDAVECDRSSGLGGLSDGLIWLDFNTVFEIDHAEPVARRRDSLRVLSEHLVIDIDDGGQVELLSRLTSDVPQKLDGHFLTGLPTGRNHGEGSRIVADVTAVVAVPVAAVAALANLDDVLAVSGSDDRRHAVLPQQSRIVAGREFKPSGIHDRDVRVEQRVAEPNPLDFSRDAIALLHINDKIVHIFVLNDPFNGRVEGDFLRHFEVAVRLLLHDVGKGTDAKGSEIGQATGRANANVFRPQHAVRGQLQLRLNLASVDDRELGDFDPRLVDHQFLSVLQPLPIEEDFDLRPALATARNDVRQHRASGKHGCRHQKNDEREQSTDHHEPFIPNSTDISPNSSGSSKRQDANSRSNRFDNDECS